MDKKRRENIKLFHAMKLGEKLKQNRYVAEALLGYKEGPVPKEIDRILNKEIKNFYTYLDIQKQYVQVWQSDENFAYGIYTLGPKIQEEIIAETDPVRKEILHILSVITLGIQGEEFLEEVRSKTGKYITEIESPNSGTTGLPLEYNKKILEMMYSIKNIKIGKNHEFTYKYTKAVRCRLNNKKGEYIEKKPLQEGSELWMTYRYLFYTQRDEFYKKVKKDYPNYQEKIHEILEQFSLETLKKYRTLGIPDTVFLDTFKDINNQKEVEKAIDMKCFKIGRLKFQMLNIEEIKDLKEKLNKLDTQMAKIALKKINHNKLALLNVYVDEIGPLDYTQCKKSYKEAAEFFIRYFIEIGDYQPQFAFIFNGWLLNQDLHNYLPEDSNILKFQKDYEIIGKNNHNTLMLKHIFGETKKPIDELPENTTLQKNIKKALQEGKKFGSYRGIYLDTNNDLGVNYPEGLISYKIN